MPKICMIDIDGLTLSDIERQILKNPQIGGVILFDKNFHTQAQLQQLTGAISALRPDILIAVDQEGGNIQRFKRQGMHCAVAAKRIGDLHTINPRAGLQFAQHEARAVSQQLRDLGVTLNFAPVCDLHDPASTIIGALDRAFSADPQVVCDLSAAYIDGMHEAGMPSVAKHFPGHGRVILDSHVAQPTLDNSRSDVMQQDVYPFAELIRRNKIDAVMAAHVIYPGVDPQHAAGFSKIWLQDILRKQLGFDGVIMSDCLSMKGADIGNLATRATQAIEAGCDMLIICQQSRQDLLVFLEQWKCPENHQSSQRISVFLEKCGVSQPHAARSAISCQ